MPLIQQAGENRADRVGVVQHANEIDLEEDNFLRHAFVLFFIRLQSTSLVRGIPGERATAMQGAGFPERNSAMRG